MNQRPFGYYSPPVDTSAAPAVIILYRLYAAMMVLAYLGSLLVMGAWGSFSPKVQAPPFLIVVGILALASAVFHLVGAAVPRKPWAWTYGLVLLSFGIVGGGLFFAVPLLIFWIRPECKAAFMRV